MTKEPLTPDVGRQADTSTKQLSEYLSTTRYDDLPVEVVERAILTIADTIAVGLAGSQHDLVSGLSSQLRSGHSATLLAAGFPGRKDPVATAIANSVQICSVELDEGASGGGHPALHVLPAVLAASEAAGYGGRELIEAFVLGYEAHCRVQSAAQLRPEIYPHGNTGTIGTVVGLGKLRNWDGDQMTRGIQMAAAFPIATSYAPCLSGADVATALAAASLPIAHMVVDMVEAGMDGDPQALADTFGSVLGIGFDSDMLVKGLGKEFALSRNHLKFHASCGVIHPVLEAAATALGSGASPGRYPPVRLETAPDPDSITRIRVVADPRAKRLDYIAADRAVSAKFSLPFSLAAFLTRAELTPASYDGGALRDARLRALESRIDIDTDPGVGPGSASGDLARVKIQYTNGRIVRGTCRGIYGRTTSPWTPEDLRAKFMALASPVLGETTSRRLFHRIESLATLPTVESLFRPGHEVVDEAESSFSLVTEDTGKDPSWTI